MIAGLWVSSKCSYKKLLLFPVSFRSLSWAVKHPLFEAMKEEIYVWKATNEKCEIYVFVVVF